MLDDLILGLALTALFVFLAVKGREFSRRDGQKRDAPPPGHPESRGDPDRGRP
jgi:hypothetical protein